MVALAKVFPSWANLDCNEEREPYTTSQIIEVVNSINQRAPQGPLQGLTSLTAIFQNLYVIEDNSQVADQL